ncbi:copper chaperone PCu(A)C [Kocuria rhizophila]|nr:copper chaperone PCu(A)C [Kocuria rhizophila]
MVSDSGRARRAGARPPGPLELSDGWAKAARPGRRWFVIVTNTSDQEVTLKGASAHGSRRTWSSTRPRWTPQRVHADEEEGRRLQRLPPAERELEPGANHIMLMGLTCSLQAGSDLPLQPTDGAPRT